MNTSEQNMNISYVPSEHGVGIVHLGVGAFHRAHQAVYTDAALGNQGGDWRIVGASLRSSALAQKLNTQNGRYTLIERGAEGSTARTIASIDRVIAGNQGRSELLSVMAHPAIRIVSLTVTEKAYGISRETGEVDQQHPDIAADLANPGEPHGVVGLLVEALRLRRAAGVVAFAVMCCDNLPDNGKLIRSVVVSYAKLLDGALADWISQHVAFPSTMVDRITPAASQKTFADALSMTGQKDTAAIETERFTQWVIEDNFPEGRPYWEAGGAIFVENVEPYERMKLRMLNGSHTMLAYSGYLSGCSYVRDVMACPELKQLVSRHLKAASLTLTPLPGIDFDQYASELIERFRNPNIAHETYQIAMDGTEKLPQRILDPAVYALKHEQDLRPFAFAVAAWMRYCLGVDEQKMQYDLRDPKEQEISIRLDGVPRFAEGIVTALHGLPSLFPDELLHSSVWYELVTSILQEMLDKGVVETIKLESTRG